MMSSMTGHRLTWGVPVETGGFQIVASSFRELTGEQLNALVTMTDVGRIEERGFTDAFGFFGEFRTNGATWAVFSHFYRSLQPMFTGQYFVQRDIFLAPVAVFREAEYDALPFLQAVSPPRVFPRAAQKIDKWSLDLQHTPADERQQRLKSLDDAFLEPLLRAFLQPNPTIIVWQAPDLSLLTGLLLLFPKVVRERLTFCTAVGELAAAKVNIKIVPSFRAEPSSVIADLDKHIFRQSPFTIETSLPAQLLDVWRKGRLRELHHYVDEAVIWTGSQVEFVRALDAAVAQWRSMNEVRHALSGPSKWDVAQAHIEIIGRAPERHRTADRLFLASELVLAFDAATESDRFSEFLRALTPDHREMTAIEEAAGERLAKTPATAMPELAKAIASALPRDGALQNLARETFARIPPERRTLDALPQLEAAFTGKRASPLPPDVVEAILGEWTFGHPPQAEQVRALMERVGTPEQFSLVKKNKALSAELTHVPHGHIALQLVATRFEQGNTAELFDLAAKYPDAASEVVAWPQAKEWIRLPRFGVLLIAQIVDAARQRKRAASQNDALLPLFVDYLERAEDHSLLEDGKVQFAMMNWAAVRSADWKRRVEVVRSRGEGVAAEEHLKKMLLEPALAWKNGSAGALRQLIAVVSGTPRWAWFILSELHDDAEFPLAKFCLELRESGGSDAVPLLRMMATLVLLHEGEPRADAVDVLSQSVQGTVRVPPNVSRLRTRLTDKWTPSDHQEYAQVLALLSAFDGARASDENLRRRGLANMPTSLQMKAILDRCSSFSIALREVRKWPELERAERLADEPDVDIAPAEKGIQNVLNALADEALDRELKDRLARLRRKKKEGWPKW
jgi:hypothetical protein